MGLGTTKALFDIILERGESRGVAAFPGIWVVLVGLWDVCVCVASACSRVSSGAPWVCFGLRVVWSLETSSDCASNRCELI